MEKKRREWNDERAKYGYSLIAIIITMLDAMGFRKSLSANAVTVHNRRPKSVLREGLFIGADESSAAITIKNKLKPIFYM